MTRHPTRHRPEPENNSELRPETQPECSLTRPIPVGLGWVGFSGGPGPCYVLEKIQIRDANSNKKSNGRNFELQKHILGPWVYTKNKQNIWKLQELKMSK